MRFPCLVADVLPSDEHRVKLSLEHGTSDFINAVYIDGYKRTSAFILTQTPSPVGTRLGHMSTGHNPLSGS